MENGWNLMADQQQVFAVLDMWARHLEPESGPKGPAHLELAALNTGDRCLLELLIPLLVS